MLSVRNISRSFGGFAIKDVSFDVAEGEYFVLLGPSGAGKSLLLEAIAGIHLPDDGTILLDGADITHERIQNRRCALVYQDQALFPHMTVRRNVAYALSCNGLARTAVADRTLQLARSVGVDNLLDSKPATLSGGEAQRTALARALATNPRCLLLDEPLSSLDVKARRELRSLMRSLNRGGQTMIHVTHDYEEALSLASRVAIVSAGQVVQVGEPEDVFRHPASEFVANFIGVRNFFAGRLRRLDGGDHLGEFAGSGAVFRVLSDAEDAEGYLMLRSEDVIVSSSRPETSAQNSFRGTIADIAASRLGVEVVVDIGVQVTALLTADSIRRLSLACGQEAWVSFKASAAKFLSD